MARWIALLPLHLRRTWRATRTRPSLALTIVGTIALVMGAAAVAFAVFDATLLRPLPYPDDERLVVVYTLPPAVTETRFRNPLHAVDLLRVRERARTLAALDGVVVREHSVAGAAADPEALPVGHASAGLFATLGLPVAFGRTFTADEDLRRHRVAVLTHAYWQTAFAGSPDAVGRKVVIDGEPHDIVGVLAARAATPFAAVSLWRPLGISDTNLPFPFATFVLGIGRLTPGASMAAANDDVRSIMTALRRELPKTHDGWSAGVVGLREWQFGEQRYAVAIVMSAAVLIVFVAWINILNLCLADAIGRRAEHAISLAIGATRTDLMGAQIVGTLALMGAGAGAGLVLASWILPTLQTFDRGVLGPIGELAVGFRVQLLVAAATAIAGVLAGAIPMGRIGLNASHESPRVLGSWRGRLVRIGLVAAQSAAVVVLIACSLVLAKTVYRMHRAPTGFSPDGVLAVQLRMPSTLYPTMDDRANAIARFMQSIEALPGVAAVGSATNPLSPGSFVATQIEVEGATMPNQQPVPVQFRMISGDYFRALRIPLLAGRAIGADDTARTPLAAVVSKLLAERFWPGRNPIGYRLRRPLVDPRWITIVGVADDVSDIRVGQPPDGILYMPYAQFNPDIAPVALMVRGDGDPDALAAPVRRAILSHNPLQPIFAVRPLQSFVAASFAPQYFRTWALSLLTIIGLGLGAVGVYGIVSRTVAERTPEIGLRKALGASNWRALAPGTRDTIAAVALGLIVGVPFTYGTAWIMGSVLPEIARIDLPAIAAATTATALMALAAAIVPVRRAYRIDPLAAIKTV
ncbi:MAG TPA: ABC transporter permease [Vicinamibacterales bacterium]